MSDRAREESADRRSTDCYSAGEREAMRWSQELRGYCLRPLLGALTSCGIGPDHVTFASLLCGLAFCPFYFVSPPAAFVALWLHVLLDGVDGPLARFAGVASRRGSFTDSMADQTVVAATTITLMADSTLNVWAGGVYLFVYTLIVAFAMVRNAFRIPYTWVVRPRFIVYAWIVADHYLPPDLRALTLVVCLCDGLLVWKALTGFWKIRRYITELDDPSVVDREVDGRPISDPLARPQSPGGGRHGARQEAIHSPREG
jgi:phosphatidylglycerophosphate synthase